MAYNCDIGFKYYYPNRYQFYPTNQLPRAYVTQCYNNSNFNVACQNQLRKLQNREVTMEYWIRQLEYFRNLLKNFSAEIESPEDLKTLMATCKYDESNKKCFEKRRTFCNIDRSNKSLNFCKCCCNSCLDKLLLQLCNCLNIPAMPANKCNCSACSSRNRCRCQKSCCTKCLRTPNPRTPQNQPCNYYVPYQAYCPTPAYHYYYYYYPPQQQQQPPCQTPLPNQPCYPNYCYPQQQPPCQTPPPNHPCYPTFCQQTSNNCCQSSCDTCSNKCKFKYLLNQINHILTSAEQMKMPCQCGCANNDLCKKSCCSIQEIKEETVKIKRECVLDNNTDKNVDKCCGNTIENENQKTCQNENHKTCQTQDLVESRQDTDNVISTYDDDDVDEEDDEQYTKVKETRKYRSESSKSQTIYSDDETIDEASNISEEYKNTRVKKQASIILGEEYMSPSGTFEVLIQDQPKKSSKKSSKKSKKRNSSVVFQVGYTTYTKPKSDVEREI